MTRPRLTWLLPLSLSLNIALGGSIAWRWVRARYGPHESRTGAIAWYHRPASHAFSALKGSQPDIVFAGDSLVAEGPWGELFGGVANRGVHGDTLAGLRLRLDEIIARNPASLVLLIGINDLLRGASPSQLRIELDAVLTKLRTRLPHCQVLLLSLLPISPIQFPTVVTNPEIKHLNSVFAQTATAHAVRFIDLSPAFTDASGNLRAELTYDGLHLTPRGYELIAKALNEQLNLKVPRSKPLGG